MTKQGNYAAFRRVQPTHSGIAEDIKYWNEDRAAKRQEARLDDAIKKAEAEKKKAEREANYDKIKPQQIWDAGPRSLTELAARALTTAKSLYPEVVAVLNDPNASEEAKTKATVDLQSLNQTADNLKIMFDTTTKEWNAREELLDKDLIHYDPKTKEAWDQGYKNMEIGFDENYQPVIAYLDKKKVDGSEGQDGLNDLISSSNLLGIQSLGDMMKGVPLGTYRKKHNKEGLAKAIADEVGTTDITTDKNYTKHQVKQLNDDAISLRVQSLLYDKKGEPSSVMASLLIQADKDPETATETDLKFIEQEFTKLVKSYEKNVDLTDVDNASRIAAGRLALSQKQAEGTTSGFGELVVPSETTWGKDKIKTLADGAMAMSAGDVKFGALKGTDGVVHSNAIVKYITTDKNGKIVAQIEVPEYRTITDTDAKKIEDAAKNGDAEAQDMKASFYREEGTGKIRIVKPGTNQLKVITLSNESANDIAKLGKVTVDGLAKTLGFDGKRQNDSNKKPKYKGLDEEGNPVFE